MREREQMPSSLKGRIAEDQEVISRSGGSERPIFDMAQTVAKEQKRQHC